MQNTKNLIQLEKKKDCQFIFKDYFSIDAY